MNENKSYIFFQELTGPVPLGALGRPVTSQVTVAADPKFVPLGAPVFIQADRPEANGLWVAQDTGGAIKGANRFDTFWGAGDYAATVAGGMSARGRAYLLLPKGAWPGWEPRVHRPLSAEERALWAKVIESVRPMHAQAAPPAIPAEPAPPPPPPPVSSPKPPPARARPAAPKPKPQPGETLDSTWDRRLSRGLLRPICRSNLHGHNLATLTTARSQARTRRSRWSCGAAPDHRQAAGRRAADRARRISAAVGDWLAASRHAGAIAGRARRSSAPWRRRRLYIVLRRDADRCAANHVLRPAR
jgi:hypothetical protein